MHVQTSNQIQGININTIQESQELAADDDVVAEPSTDVGHDRNFALLVLYQVAQRVGWIFKTESVVMPAVLDFLGGGGMLRGWLPLINRVCQSIPTVLLADRIRCAPRKKVWLFVFTNAMAVCFLVLAVCFGAFSDHPKVLQYVFLAIYGIFFVATGINQVLFNTLQGKLIPATDRGRLMLVANLIAVTAAVGAVWLLMPRWLTEHGAQFTWFFATSSIAFLVASAFTLTLHEPADSYSHQRVTGLRRKLAQFAEPLKEDANFRTLALVAVMFGASIILFPHYQALGRGGQLGGDYKSLLVWLTVQNIGTAVFSIILGPLADRRGTLLALRWVLAGIVLSPAVALLLTQLQLSWAYPVVFVLVGLTPVAIRLLMNYTLEAAPAEKHPSYLATVTLATGVPVLLSPVAGILVDVVGYAPVFLVVTAVGVYGLYLSANLQEPRSEV